MSTTYQSRLVAPYSCECALPASLNASGPWFCGRGCRLCTQCIPSPCCAQCALVVQPPVRWCSTYRVVSAAASAKAIAPLFLNWALTLGICTRLCHKKDLVSFWCIHKLARDGAYLYLVWTTIITKVFTLVALWYDMQLSMLEVVDLNLRIKHIHEFCIIAYIQVNTIIISVHTCNVFQVQGMRVYVIIYHLYNTVSVYTMGAKPIFSPFPTFCFPTFLFRV